MTEHPRVLLIDDQLGQPEDPMIQDRYGNLSYVWLQESAQGQAGFSAARALRRVRDEMPHLDLVLLDVMFGSRGNRLGIEILEAVRAEFPTLPIVMFTSLASADNRELVIRCIELGANEFVEKMPPASHMDSILRIYTDPQLDFAMYGNTTAIRNLRAQIARVAFAGETSVLTIGESGTGKELVARAIHRQGPRNSGPFVAKNCADADSELLDSELFGHERGSFTGAMSQRIGLMEEANNGVLFLDEIADMPTALQGKLLRTLERRSFRRLGGNADIESNFQLVCATNRPPSDLIGQGRLREDFYYRISTVSLTVPTLRERIEDIPALSRLFLGRFRKRGGASYPAIDFSQKFLDELQGYQWPGNIRELRNAIERAVILSRTKLIGPDELPEALRVDRQPTRADHIRLLENASLTLPPDPTSWPVARLATELRLAIEARKKIQAYKGSQWKAEFMRLLYPACKASNAKGFDDLVKRLTQGPWGSPDWTKHPELVRLLEMLRS
jgi:DNA-binding NtrC family response regulator